MLRLLQYTLAHILLVKWLIVFADDNDVGCLLPNLQYLIITNDRQELVSLDQVVANGTQVNFACQKTQTLKGNADNHCLNNRWLKSFPYCERGQEFILSVVLASFSLLCVVIIILIYRLRTIKHRLTDRVWLTPMSASTAGIT